MKYYLNPNPSSWAEISKRPQSNRDQQVEKVQAILETVQQQGDRALRHYAAEFDRVALTELRVSEAEMEQAFENVAPALKAAITVAASNISLFHSSQLQPEPVVETMPGVRCWRQNRAIETVGLYIPGGSAPLFSTVLMLGIPARLAGCKRVIICTPCDVNGNVNAAVLYAAQVVGIREIYKVGGAQAIAAMAYGTESIPKVEKIFGPGNSYVTTAKECVQRLGTAIDLPAGPSEVLVIADEDSNPVFVASDLLSQAEHGSDSQVVLVTTSEKQVAAVQAELQAQLEVLPRAELAKATLANSLAIVLSTIQEAIAFSNVYAPEHLLLSFQVSDEQLALIQNAGSVFVGPYACESAGDYASGTNHTLPTNGYARSYSGVSLDSFVKKITFQTLSAAGIQQLGTTIETLAEAESLLAHKNAVTVRLNALRNEKN